MTGFKIRESFLKYFEKNGHARVKSSSLVPANDPTLFFTNAGMVQFKDLFLGEDKRDYRRACSSQKCMRVSGKHNDLENVGHTPRHHTFFEMLGNFSFGDYFKEEAIAFAWDFLTKEISLDPKNMYVTVFRDDDEAEKLWLKHVSKDRVFRLGEKDNFWAMGDTGPCGPCSEIIWDFGKGHVRAEDLDTTRFMELWNLVFMQFSRDASGEMSPLAAPSIDTGMGLERLAAVLQGFKSNWETDIFLPIIKVVSEVSGHRIGESDESDIAMRVIADHVRGSVFLVGDGVTPSNEGRGYVLRRILRRAVRYGKRLGIDEPFLTSLIPIIVDEMGSAYPDLILHKSFIEKVIGTEEGRFYQTLDNGLELLKDAMACSRDKVIPGEVAFKLYDTFGFPLDVTRMIAAESGFVVDEGGFEKKMSEQRERARASWKGSGENGVCSIYKKLVADGVSSSFVGYSNETADGEILAILKDGVRVKEAHEHEDVYMITSETPFYGESGGQVGDRGTGIVEGGEVEIIDTKKPLPDLIVHHCRVQKGKISEGMKITLVIDMESRRSTRCNHTATHLLHRALREVLGEHVKQAGSLVMPERLRFDFSHFHALTHEELREVERHVNATIRQNIPVLTYDLEYDEAVRRGALAFFGEKYGDRVRMIDVSGHSSELCGGTHVNMTGEIGMFKILSESSVAAGVRRIEAVTGIGAEDYIDAIYDERKEIAAILKASPAEIVDRVRKLDERVSSLERELKKALTCAAQSVSKDFLQSAEDFGSFKAIIAKSDVADRKILGELAEKYRDRLGTGAVLLASVSDGRVTLISAVSKQLSAKIKAGEIVRMASEVLGGKGGGRPDFAQGGGADSSKLDQAFKKIREYLKGAGG
ncbi:MAG TPA: alanine--tRNA ligase [bacterium]|nr:alanine--tRNA ligase [Myxococcales bacterium]OQA58699.1 MAG: Alanine--tRNA ligase [bacterium ADurb.Bin270]HPW45016.1 alanine--tRNA ligase [bacterium]HQC50879.1 alanine--tRNA ligase [bacterium]